MSSMSSMSSTNMVTLADSDFDNFLVDLDLGFAEGINVDPQPGQSGLAISVAQIHQHLDPNIDPNIDPNLIASTEAASQNAAMFDFSMPMDLQFQLSQDSHPAPGQGIIPPTPNSVEMHGNAASYLQQYEAHRLLMEQYQLKKHEANLFTPLVSPVVSAHDGHYDLPLCYTVPGAYLSPLTSPAIEGQQHPYQNTTSASSVATASPIDLDADMHDIHQHHPPATRSSRKRLNTPRSATNLSKSVNSPASKPQTRRKTGLKSSVSEKDVRSHIERNTNPHHWAQSPNIIASQQTSGESVSPEPLGDSMGPPQKPASATASPAILAKNASKGRRGMPATPASYLMIQQSQPTSPQHGSQAPRKTNSIDVQQPMLTPLSLPEAATTHLAADDDPDVTSRKTPKLGPLSTPSGSATPLATFPMTTPTSTVNSPLSAGFPPVTKKSDGRSRHSKKRGSISSNALVSPALRPKISISPNIKPNIPETSTVNDADAHTMFLASRSNYQNLIEGTHVPGVSYPQELSSNLTSKRTSHKIAEQGRRNRINVALQEMQHLLPKDMPHEDQSPQEEEGSSASGKKNEGGSGKANGNSKASTVESAIEYIMTLQKEHEDMRSAKEKRDKENEALRRRLKEMEKYFGEKGLSLPNVEEEDSSSTP